MLDEKAISRIAELGAHEVNAGTRVTEVEGVPLGTMPLHDLRRKIVEPLALQVHTLTGLADYIRANRDRLDLGDLVIHVVDVDEVALRSRIEGPFNQRLTYAGAENFDRMQGFPFGSFQPREQVHIAIQSRFADSDDRALVLKLLGNIVGKEVKTVRDDGVGQQITVNRGMGPEWTEIPHTVTLAPYRTFAELEQPASPFIVRVRENAQTGDVMVGVFEADGGAWRLEAIKRIRRWLDGENLGVAIIA